MAGVLLCLDWKPLPAPQRWAVVLTFAGAGFLQWKQDFTRHDYHSIAFFSFALVAPFLVPAGPAARRGRRWAGNAFLGASALLSVVGLGLAGIALSPDKLVDGVAKRLAANTRYLLM